MLEVYLLGRFTVTAPGGELVLPTAKVRLLSAYLFWCRGEWQNRETLRGMLWPESDEERAAGNLRMALYSFRRALDDCGAPSGILEIRRDVVRVADWSDCRIDAREFERKALAGLSGGAGGIETMMAAAELYRGLFLAEMDADWCLAERERLADLHRGVLRALAERLAASGLLEAAASYARRWLAVDPLDEAAYQTLMRLYAAMGRPALAASHFAHCERILRSELGIAPNEATLRLYRELDLARCQEKPKESGEGRKKTRASGGNNKIEEPLSPDPLREARLLLAKGESMALQEENLEGLHLIEKALKVYERFGGIAAKARLILGEAMLWLSVPLTPVMDQTLRRKAIGHLQEAAEYYRRNGLSSELGRALLLLAEAYWNEGKNGEAAAAAREGLELARRLGDQEAEGLLATILGMALRELFHLAEARAAFAQAVEAIPGLTNNWQIQWLLLQRGILSYITGDLAEAEGFLREAMVLNKSIAFPGLQAKVGECMIRSMFLVIFHYQDRRGEMPEYIIPPGMEKYNPESFVYLDPLFCRAKEPAAILPDLAEWLRVRLYRLPQPMLACTIRVAVEEMLAAGMTEEAACWAAVGIRQARARGWRAVQALFYAFRAVALARLGRLVGAERCRRLAGKYVEDPDRWAPAWLARADGAVAQARGNFAEAARSFTRSICLFNRMGAFYDARCVEAEMEGEKAAATKPGP